MNFTYPNFTHRRWPYRWLLIGGLLAALLVPAAIGTTHAAAVAATSCTKGNESIIDDTGRVFTPVYHCATYVDAALIANYKDTAKPSDDSGFMAESADVVVICQQQGRANPVVQTNTNTWWLYTKGNSARANDFGYTNGWGYLPATAVKQGASGQPVPGVPQTCPNLAPGQSPAPPPPPTAPTGCANTDCDGDHFQTAIDCDDANPAINPGATDVPGNAVDEDCKDGPAPYPRLDSAIRFIYNRIHRQAAPTRLAVSPARAGSTVLIRCNGPGCPKSLRLKFIDVKADSNQLNLTKYVRHLRLRRHARFEVWVAKKGTIGRVAQMEITRFGNAARHDLCTLPPDFKRAVRCTL